MFFQSVLKDVFLIDTTDFLRDSVPKLRSLIAKTISAKSAPIWRDSDVKGVCAMDA